jgi:uncharacterized membrane protein YfhO
VLSEVYFPAGWKAFIDGTETEIFKTNHVLRSVLVPAGSAKIEFKLEPRRYYSSLRISGISMAIVYLLLAAAALQFFLKRKRTVQPA